jgi:hypothetical protein
VTTDFVSGIVDDPVQNEELGRYWQSIITSFLSHDEEGWHAEISDEPWIIDDTRPSAEHSPYEFNVFFAALARRYQDHRFHNHSCFKDSAPGGVVNISQHSHQQASPAGSSSNDPSSVALATLRSQSIAPRPHNSGQRRLKESLCRFIRPVPAFSFQPQYVQLVMLEINSPLQGSSYVVRALRGVEAPPIGHRLSLISKESRCLEFQFARPASSGSTNTDPSQSQYFPLEEGKDPNCWFVECNQAITVGTGAHNNIQQLDGRDLGGAAYMSKYLVKNNLRPEKSLSILYEALQHVARYPSVASDAAADPSSRRIIHIVERVLNSTRGAIELSMPLILGRLLGMQQFETSHSYKSVFLSDAVSLVRQRLRGIPLETHDSIGEIRDTSARNDEEAFVPEVVAEDNEEAHAELTRDRAGRLALVSQKIDYLYRDVQLADWNLVEFVITFYKCPNDGTSTVEGDELDDGLFNDSLYHDLIRIRKKDLVLP